MDSTVSLSNVHYGVGTRQKSTPLFHFVISSCAACCVGCVVIFFFSFSFFIEFGSFVLISRIRDHMIGKLGFVLELYVMIWKKRIIWIVNLIYLYQKEKRKKKKTNQPFGIRLCLERQRAVEKVEKKRILVGGLLRGQPSNVQGKP